MSSHARYRDFAAGSVDGLLLADEQRELDEHLVGCDSCRADLARFDQDRSALADLTPVPPSAAVRARVEAARRPPHGIIRWPLLVAALLGLGASGLLLRAGAAPPVPDGQDPPGPSPLPAISMIEPIGSVDTAAGSGPVEAGDVDGDGSTDLVLAASGAPAMRQVLFGDGQGGFEPPTMIEASDPGDVVVVDVDGDGIDDIVALGASDAVPIQYGHAGRAIAPPVRVPVGCPPSDAVAAHVEGDVRRDLVVSCETGAALFVLRAVGGRRLVAQAGIETNPGGRALAWGDIDADGVTDVILGSSTSDRMAVHLGASAGLGPALITEVARVGDIEAGALGPAGEVGVAMVDLDQGAVTVRSTADGRVWDSEALPMPTGARAIGDLEVGDLDGDGHDDVVVIDRVANELIAWLHRGDAGWADPLVATTAAAPGWIEFMSVAGSDRPDLVVTYERDPRIDIFRPR